MAYKMIKQWFYSIEGIFSMKCINYGKAFPDIISFIKNNRKSDYYDNYFYMPFISSTISKMIYWNCSQAMPCLLDAMSDGRAYSAEDIKKATGGKVKSSLLSEALHMNLLDDAPKQHKLKLYKISPLGLAGLSCARANSRVHRVFQ